MSGLPNPVVEAILSRRSTREGLSSNPIPRSSVEIILQCGMASPSSKNAKPWRFNVVTGSSTLISIADAMERASDIETYVPADPATGRPWPHWRSTVCESASVLREVPLAIVIENRGVFSRGRASLLSATEESRAAAIVGYGFEQAGIGAAIQSMWLAAHSLGLQGVFMGDVLIVENVIKALLAIEGDVAGVLALSEADRNQPGELRLPELTADFVRWDQS